MDNSIQVRSKDLIYGAFTFHPAGLEIKGNPTFEEWMKCGDFVKKANKSVHFWIGDWLNYGENTFGEMFSQALEENYSAETLKNDKWVSSKIEPARRHDNLTWTHHQEVAELMPEDQDLLLKQAEDEGLNTRQFRQLTRNYKLHQEVPEMKEHILTPADFAVVQEVIDPSLVSLDKLQGLNLDQVHIDARDYLFSHLKQAVGIMAGILSKYGK